MYLYFAVLARAIHSAGHIDGVPPDVVLGLAGPYNPRHHGAVVDTCRPGHIDNISGLCCRYLSFKKLSDLSSCFKTILNLLWAQTLHSHIHVIFVHYTTGPVFIKHLKSNVYVITLNAIGSFLCYLCFHWLIQIFIT